MAQRFVTVDILATLLRDPIYASYGYRALRRSALGFPNASRASWEPVSHSW